MDSFFFFSLSIYLFPSFFPPPLLSHSRQTGIVWTSEGIRKELSEASSDELVCLYFIRKVRILGEKKEIRRKERFSFNLNLARAVALRSIGKKEFNMASRASCLNAFEKSCDNNNRFEIVDPRFSKFFAKITMIFFIRMINWIGV